jgi:hypothetical protein
MGSTSSSSRAWRYLWAAPCSVVGVVALAPLALWGCGLRVRWRAGIVEASLRRTRRLPFDAITLGHVVIAVSPQAMQRLRVHEREHVRQCERWGPLFFPAYLAAGAWQWLCGREAYRDNPFEVAARAAETHSWRLRASGGFFAK